VLSSDRSLETSPPTDVHAAAINVMETSAPSAAVRAMR
jgi:hypothetical protein